MELIAWFMVGVGIAALTFAITGFFPVKRKLKLKEPKRPLDARAIIKTVKQTRDKAHATHMPAKDDSK